MACELGDRSSNGIADACAPVKGAKVTSIVSAKAKLDKDLLLATCLTKVDCNFDMVKPQLQTTTDLKSAVRKERREKKGDVSILYAMRHPACCMCRQKGRALAEFAATDSKIAMATVVKDTGKVDRALLTYYKKYGNRNTIYMDPEWGIYKAMGGRKVPFFRFARKIVRSAIKNWRGNAVADVSQALKSDLWTQGGVLFFDRRGYLVHVIYEPQFGDDLNMDEVKQAVQKARLQNKEYSEASTYSGMDPVILSVTSHPRSQ